MALVEILEEKDIYELNLSKEELSKHIYIAAKFIVSRSFSHQLVRHKFCVAI